MQNIRREIEILYVQTYLIECQGYKVTDERFNDVADTSNLPGLRCMEPRPYKNHDGLYPRRNLERAQRPTGRRGKKATDKTTRGYLCQCGCGLRGTDYHHALIPRQKRYKAWLDCEENYILVNHAEHLSGKFDTWEWRRIFWRKQVARYGERHMRAWLEGLPEKLRYRVDFVEKG